VYDTGYGGTNAGPGIGVLKEDLIDLIQNIDVWDNILFAMLPKRRALSTTHEWFQDTIPVASRAGVNDGAEFDPSSLTNPTKTQNFTQIFRFDVAVTGTIGAVNLAGIRNPYLYHILNGTHAIAKAVEERFFDQPTAPNYGGAASATSPRRFKTLATMLDASMVVDAALATLTPDHVDSAMETAYANGIRPEYLFLSHGVKADFSRNVAAATGIGTRNIASVDKRIIRSIDIYEGDFGAVSAIPNRSIPQVALPTDVYGWAWLLQRDKLGVAVLRPIQHTPLAKTGDNTKGMILGELTFELLHSKGAAAIKQVIT
jgi:hypothetical protein